MSRDWIDPKQQQIHTHEQRVVLSALARSVAASGCRFLEVGSWCGDSTVLLGRIAQENGGQIFCVDWWKGNVDTELTDIAEKLDVFSIFWSNIREAGLEDTVVPIRARSDQAADILKAQKFDLVFIDADHRYGAVSGDIDRYARLVRRPRGVFCGHDCEGRVSDFERDFLEAGMDADTHEGVHCGVVLAVGAAFEAHSLNHAIWSVRAVGRKGTWEPTDLDFPDIADRASTPSPVIGLSKGFSILRYGRHVYAVPVGLTDFDVTQAPPEGCDLPKSMSVAGIEALIGETVVPPPQQIGEWNGYRLLRFEGLVYALRSRFDPADIVRGDIETWKSLCRDRNCLVATSEEAVKDLIAELDKDASIEELKGSLLEREAAYNTLNEDWARRGARIEELQNEILVRDERIKELQATPTE